MWFAATTKAADDVRSALERGDDVATVKKAIESGRVGVNEIISYCGSTMLHVAAARGRFESVKFLLGREDINVNAQEKFWCTALHSARLAKTFSMLAMDLRVDLSVKSRFGRTAGDMLCGMGAKVERRDENLSALEKAKRKRERVSYFIMRIFETHKDVPRHVFETYITPCIQDGPAFST
eukprot:gene959-484_t